MPVVAERRNRVFVRALLVVSLLLFTLSAASAQTRCDACRLVIDPVTAPPLKDPNANRIVFKEAFAVGASLLIGDVLTAVIVATVISLLVNGGTGGLSLVGILEQIARFAAGVLIGAVIAIVHLFVAPAYAGLAAGWVAERPTTNSRGLPILVTYGGLVANIVAVVLLGLGGALFTPVGLVVSVALSIAIRYVATPALASWVLHKDFSLGSGNLLDTPPLREDPPVAPIRWIPAVDRYGHQARGFGGI